VVAFGAVVLYNLLFPGPKALTQDDVDARVSEALASVTPAPAFSELVYEAVRPSVVLVQIERPRESGGTEIDEGVGSGVVINLAGEILTSLHVVADATSVKVTFADGTSSQARSLPAMPATTSPSFAPPSRRRRSCPRPWATRTVCARAARRMPWAARSASSIR
jgi:S1-C subfamily serine protease